MFPLICVWINGWVNNRDAGDLRRYRPHYDVIVMLHVHLKYGTGTCNFKTHRIDIDVDFTLRAPEDKVGCYYRPSHIALGTPNVQWTDYVIVMNVGGKSQNILNEILKNFINADFEVQTFDDSSYIDTDSMTGNLWSRERVCSLVRLNIQSTNANLTNLQLSYFLNELDFMFSDICTQETWLKNDKDTYLRYRDIT